MFLTATAVSLILIGIVTSFKAIAQMFHALSKFMASKGKPGSDIVESVALVFETIAMILSLPTTALKSVAIKKLDDKV